MNRIPMFASLPKGPRHRWRNSRWAQGEGVGARGDRFGSDAEAPRVTEDGKVGKGRPMLVAPSDHSGHDGFAENREGSPFLLFWRLLLYLLKLLPEVGGPPVGADLGKIACLGYVS